MPPEPSLIWSLGLSRTLFPFHVSLDHMRPGLASIVSLRVSDSISLQRLVSVPEEFSRNTPPQAQVSVVPVSLQRMVRARSVLQKLSSLTPVPPEFKLSQKPEVLLPPPVSSSSRADISLLPPQHKPSAALVPDMRVSSKSPHCLL